MPPPDIPEIVISRLPLYLRALIFLEQEGREITSSQELADKLGFSSAQIRKDLSYFGEFGKQGTGYNVKYLKEQLKKILKIDREWNVALIGAGDLGHAIAHYGGFKNRGFRVAAIFDVDPKKIGEKMGELTIRDMTELPSVAREMGLKIAIVAVPANAGQAVVDTLVEAGFKAILNYAPITLNVPSDVRIYYIDPVIGLQSMTYYL